jgi:hypothetical protein
MKNISLLAASLFIILTITFATNESNFASNTFKLVSNSSNTEYLLDTHAQVRNSRIYIDEIYKLQQYTDLLVNKLYLPPYPSFQSFIKIKRNLNKTITPTCHYFDQLMLTTGKLKSPFKHDAIHCKNALESLLVVLRDLQQGKHSQIKLEHQKLSIINNQLVNQLVNQLKDYEDLYVVN